MPHTIQLLSYEQTSLPSFDAFFHIPCDTIGSWFKQIRYTVTPLKLGSSTWFYQSNLFPPRASSLCFSYSKKLNSDFSFATKKGLPNTKLPQRNTPQKTVRCSRFLGKATIHFLWVIAMLMWRIPTSPGRRRLGPGFCIWIWWIGGSWVGFSWKIGITQGTKPSFLGILKIAKKAWKTLRNLPFFLRQLDRWF